MDIIRQQSNSRVMQFIQESQAELDQFIISDISKLCLDFYYIQGIPILLDDINKLMDKILVKLDYKAEIVGNKNFAFMTSFFLFPFSFLLEIG